MSASSPRPPAPLELRPHLAVIVRVSAHADDVDAVERAALCIAGFRSGPPPEPDAGAGAGIRALFDVLDPVAALATLDPVDQRAARAATSQFESTVAPYLPAPLGTVSSLALTCLSSEQGGLAGGTLVLVRESDVVTEQYVFPFLSVDPATGRETMTLPPPAEPGPSHGSGIRPMGQGAQVGQQIVGALMAVTPFLPPPYGPVATGILSFVNLMLGIASDDGGDGPSPLAEATQAIEEFVRDTTLGTLAGQIHAPADEFANMAKTQTQPIETLSSISGGIQYMQGMLQATWTPAVVSANGQLYELLKMCGTTNFASTLSLLVSGVTTELLMYHGQVSIGAIAASVAYRERDLSAYGAADSMWQTVAGTAALDIGTSRAGAWSADDITTTMATSTAYLPKIEAWMAKAKADRLAKISGTTRSHFQTASVVGNDMTTSDFYGWTFTDGGVGADQGYLANNVEDTPSSTVCGDWHQHRDVAESNRAAYIAKIDQQVEDLFAPHRQAMATWTTYIADLLALMPPAIPSAPTATGLTTGTSTPAGEWSAGDSVRYALMAKGAKGPSPASDWSTPLTIGAVVGADLGGIAAVPGADTLVVLRSFRSHGSAEWGAVEEIAALTGTPPATYRDESTGGDPW